MSDDQQKMPVARRAPQLESQPSPLDTMERGSALGPLLFVVVPLLLLVLYGIFAD